MEEYSNDFRIELDTFDKQLMKLIALRGKLAEEIGVPIGGKQWLRYETFTM
jgi:chorismate mutase